MTDTRELLRQAEADLAGAGVASAAHDAAELLSHVVGIPRMTVASAIVAPEQADAYRDLVRRRASREPLQHLTGVAYFRYVELLVGPGVFVPRPETELLAGWAIDSLAEVIAGRVPLKSLGGRVPPKSLGGRVPLKSLGGRVPPKAVYRDPAYRDRISRPVVVDLCTGSGAIAKSIAQEVPDAIVHAVEVSPEALMWAGRNLQDTDVRLHEGDLATALPDLDGEVDVVVCNPPYIPLEAWESVAREARDHDPHLALFSGEDGLDAMRALERTAARLLKPGGVVGAEHADVQGESAPTVFTATGRWSDVRDHPDLNGRPRFLTARLAR